jgi:hypothetical protein
MPPSSPTGSPRRSRKGLIIALVIALILITGGVFGYSTISSAAVSDALQKLDKKPQVNYKLDITLDSDDTKLASSFASVYAEVDKTNPNSVPVKIVVDVSSPYYSGAGEVRLINNVLYVKADALNEAFQKGAGFPAALWYSITLDSLKEIQDQYASSVKFDGFTPAKIPLKEIYAKLDDNNIITGPDFKEIGKVGDVYVRTYEFTIDKKALAAFIVGEFGNRLGIQADASVVANVEQSLEGVSFSPIRVSVSLFGTEIREATFSVSANGALADHSRGVKGINLKLSHDPEITTFIVSVPEGAIALDQIMKQEQMKRTDLQRQAYIRSSISQTRPTAEIYFDKGHTYKGLCKSTSIVSLFGEVKLKGSTPICRESINAYLIAAPLLQGSTTPQKYVCVDSTGKSVDLPKLVAGYVCK